MVEKIGRDDIIQDIRQLSHILETAHPDPYINGGGKIAYHRRLQQLIMDIPTDGMTKQEFADRLRKFLARIEDGHTDIQHDQSQIDLANPGGVPLSFEPIEERLFVSAVAKEELTPLIGSLLVSVEGVQFAELIERMKILTSYENLYQLLSLLGRMGALYFDHYLKLLVPEWDDSNQIRVVLQDTNGEEKEHTLNPPKGVQYPLFQPESIFTIPDSRGWISHHFIDEERNIAFLRIDGMSAYREAHEYWHSTGMTEFNDFARRVYLTYNDGEVPKDMKDLIAGIPSVTEQFTSMFTEMKKSDSKFLIVDLRKCIGGYDAIISILLYFLVGFEKTIPLLLHRREVQKLSEFLHGTSEEGISLEKIPYFKQVPLTQDDYDFSLDSSFYPDEERRQTTIESLIEEFKKMPSFDKEFSSREHEAIYLPKKIIVLCSCLTGSSGFDMMTNLGRIGAITVGIPSGQSGNHFGNVREFVLAYSKIIGWVSTKYFVAFPDMPMKHCIHVPDYQLTHERFASCDFDPNATVLFALDIVREL